MGTGKKEANRRKREGESNDGMGNVRVKGQNFYRSAKRVKALKMYEEGKVRRNAAGEIVQAAKYQSRDVPAARIEPNRKWFNNTRVISQSTLSAFREAMAEKANDPYQVLLRSNKLPMTLIKDGDGPNGLKKHQAKMEVETNPFATVFGPKSQRKRVKIGASNVSELADDAEKSLGTYAERQEARAIAGDADEDENSGTAKLAKEAIFNKGGSKRIWNELHKVLDSSDVVIHVLDARDPLGTRCRSVEKYLKTEARHKHLVFVLNKCDLIPTTVAAAWVRTLSKEYPCLAFHASITNSFGKGSLIALLKQYAVLHQSNRKEISVGLIGYPNVGKSSIINTLRKKKVCTTAPVPGCTKVWQYVNLTKKINLIDCPGIVPPSQHDTPEELLLRGVVRVENVEEPEQYIPGILQKVKTHHLQRTYLMRDWTDHTDFLEQLAVKRGFLHPGGKPDVNGIAKVVIWDFLRGKIPWFTPCPQRDGDSSGMEGREGRLGEMPKRRREHEESIGDADMHEANPAGEDEFEGFASDDDMGDADGAEDAMPDGQFDDDDSIVSAEEDDGSEAEDSNVLDAEDPGGEPDSRPVKRQRN